MIKHLLLLAILPGPLLEADGSSIAGALERATATTAREQPSRASRPENADLHVTDTEWRSPDISLAGFITFVLEFRTTQVSEPPGWAETEGDSWIRTMLKNLLNSRFGLSLDAEKRQLSVSATGMLTGLASQLRLRVLDGPCAFPIAAGAMKAPAD